MTKATIRAAIRDLAARTQVWPQSEAFPVATSKSVRALENRAIGEARSGEEEAAFLARVQEQPPSMMSRRELRRSIAPAWRHADRQLTEAREWVEAATSLALSLKWRPADRAIVSTWLDVFPDGPASERLAATARIAAERHDWPYKQAGNNFNLWDRTEAPRTLGRALLAASHPDDVLREAALTPGLYDARMVQEALTSAADVVAQSSPEVAARNCAALLDLMAAVGIARSPPPAVVRALVKPWLTRMPDEELKIRIQRFLLDNVGDPRSQPARWLQMEQALVERGYGDEAHELTMVLKRWLVRASFELFFKLVMASTSDRQQWARREKFWRYYMEHDHVTEAWFILGDQAERQAKAQRQALDSAGGFGRIRSGGNSTQSALLMRIGDLVIAEWSDNGSSCFWRPGAPHMPKWYDDWYDGIYLRASSIMKSAAIRQAKGQPQSILWEAKSHVAAWEYRFSEHIQHLTGIRNPNSKRWG